MNTKVWATTLFIRLSLWPNTNIKTNNYLILVGYLEDQFWWCIFSCNSLHLKIYSRGVS